jgi:hypothetical protein
MYSKQWNIVSNNSTLESIKSNDTINVVHLEYFQSDKKNSLNRKKCPFFRLNAKTRFQSTVVCVLRKKYEPKKRVIRAQIHTHCERLFYTQHFKIRITSIGAHINCSKCNKVYKLHKRSGSIKKRRKPQYVLSCCRPDFCMRENA